MMDGLSWCADAGRLRQVKASCAEASQMPVELERLVLAYRERFRHFKLTEPFDDNTLVNLMTKFQLTHAAELLMLAVYSPTFATYLRSLFSKKLADIDIQEEAFVNAVLDDTAKPEQRLAGIHPFHYLIANQLATEVASRCQSGVVDDVIISELKTLATFGSCAALATLANLMQNKMNAETNYQRLVEMMAQVEAFYAQAEINRKFSFIGQYYYFQMMSVCLKKIYAFELQQFLPEVRGLIDRLCLTDLARDDYLRGEWAGRLETIFQRVEVLQAKLVECRDSLQMAAASQITVSICPQFVNEVKVMDAIQRVLSEMPADDPLLKTSLRDRLMLPFSASAQQYCRAD